MTDDGLSCFVIEYIDGVPITKQLALPRRPARAPQAVEQGALAPCQRAQSARSYAPYKRSLRRGEAEQLFNQSLILYQKTLPTAYPSVALAKIDLGRLYLDRNRPAEAEAPLRNALRIRQTLYDDRDVRTAEVKQALGACRTVPVHYDKAEPLLQVSLAFFQDHQAYRIHTADPAGAR